MCDHNIQFECPVWYKVNLVFSAFSAVSIPFCSRFILNVLKSPPLGLAPYFANYRTATCDFFCKEQMCRKSGKVPLNFFLNYEVILSVCSVVIHASYCSRQGVLVKTDS